MVRRGSTVRVRQRALKAQQIALLETLLPLADKRGVTVETSGDAACTIGSHALLLQLTTNLVHNAIVHNLPDRGSVWVRRAFDPTGGAHRREHRRQPRPRGRRDVSRAVSARHGAHTHRPRRRRPRPGIVRSITQANDGTLTLAPRPEGGLRVTVELPAAPYANTSTEALSLAGRRPREEGET